jgi:ketosteroid isomerase-like protein
MNEGNYMSAEEDVRKVSQQFYNALTDMATGIAGKMDGIWSHDESVTAMHPIGGRDLGWKAVSNSFDQVAGLASGGKVELKDQLIRVVGDSAYEIGTETGEFKLAGNDVKIGQRVTNIYQLKDGQWKMIHHHADISTAMMDVLKKLQPSAE